MAVGGGAGETSGAEELLLTAIMHNCDKISFSPSINNQTR